MKIKRTQKHMVLQLSRKEFETLRAALDSINDGTDDGAYMDVVRFYDSLTAACGRLEHHDNNVWVTPGVAALFGVRRKP